jgi:hypothetical protein
MMLLILKARYGVRLHLGEKFVDLMVDIARRSPDFSTISNPHLAGVLARWLHKDPTKRYDTSDRIIVALSKAIGQEPPQESAAIRESFLQAAKFVVGVVWNQVVAFSLKNVLDEPNLQMNIPRVLFATINLQDHAHPVEKFDNITHFWHFCRSTNKMSSALTLRKHPFRFDYCSILPFTKQANVPIALPQK